VKLRSLHARLVAGVAFWTIGVLALAGVLAFAAVRIHPRSVLLVHNSMLIVAAATLVTAGVSVLRRGLSPLRMLQERLAAVRDGRSARLEGEYPSEVAPLVEDLNTLLDERERRVARAAARAGDLAHGLKTPLAVLTQEIDAVDTSGQHDLAVSMRRQIDRMRRQIESHLAQARAAASGARGDVRANVAQAADGLARTLERLYADRGVVIRVDAAPELAVRVPIEDLEEMIGNLLDNACKWARSRAVVSTALADDTVVIAVDDDGPGLEPPMREAVLRRGVRADESAAGSGLGLSIVADLAQIYGGSLTLDRSPDGGVRAILTLPA
jgi:signal transduction histidine kinase